MLDTVIVQALWFFLPAYFANMAPVMFTHVKFLGPLKKPLNAKVFGEHKTYYGFVVGVFAGFVVALGQAFVFVNFSAVHWLFSFPYDFRHAFWLGLLLGFGAPLGDLIKSFFKRKLRLPSGAPFFPFDQLDFVFGGLLLGALVYVPSLSYVLTLVFLTPLLQIIINIVAYKLRLKKVWW